MFFKDAFLAQKPRLALARAFSPIFEEGRRREPDI
jgi:hypothetical protein